MVKVGLRFLDKNNDIGNKTYWYIVKDKKVWADLNKAAMISISTQNSTAFKITNETGYEYRDAWVVWVDIDTVKEGDDKELVVISEIRGYNETRPRKKVSFPVWGFCGINVPERYDSYFSEPISYNFDTGLDSIVGNDTFCIVTPDGYKPLKVSFDGSMSNMTNTCESENSKLQSLFGSSENITHTLTNTLTTSNFDVLKNLIYGKNSSIINIQNEKENVKMNIKFFDAQFGKVDDVSMSIYGATFKTVGTDGLARSIAYDPTTQEYIDVPNEMIIAKGSYCYAMPCTADNLHIGEYIRHNGAWARVIDVDDAARIVVEKMVTREIATILPVRSVFGYSFYTKLITPFQSGFATADAAHPFGDILPLLMMGDGKMEDMLPLILMMGQKSSSMFDMSNPMMLMMLMNEKDGKDSDVFKMMAMMSMFNQAKPVVKTDVRYCECDCCDTERKSY
jgi:hypothetical protein